MRGLKFYERPIQRVKFKYVKRVRPEYYYFVAKVQVNFLPRGWNLAVCDRYHKLHTFIPLTPELQELMDGREIVYFLVSYSERTGVLNIVSEANVRKKW